jgi:nitrogen fixation/metabolism regulation signal transduction histidine kinase
MDIFPSPILLQENGCKFLAATNAGDDLRGFIKELRGKVVRVGEGDLHVTVGFANRYDEIGDLGRSFNHMVQQLCESREEVERLHRTQMSRVEHLATL